jgi:PAS domain S-box-containing protein
VSDTIERRIALLAPTARDGPITARVLEKAGFDCVLARDGSDLARLLEEGAAAALVAYEALAAGAAQPLTRFLQGQEPWSDLPILILTTAATRREGRLATAESLAPFGNVTLLDRPIEVITLVSAVRAASRARRRQYAARAAMAELDASEARFRVMADGTPLIMWVTDATGRIEFVNRAYCDFFGTTREAVRASGWQPLVHPDDAPAYAGAFERASAERRPFRAEARVRRGDGAWRWIESSGVPRLSPAGEFLGYAGSSPDITERKEAEESLRLSESLFRTVSDANLIGVAFADASGRVTHVNDEMLRMAGYTRADFEAGRIDLARSVAPEFADSVRRTAEELSRAGVSIGYERAFLRPDGRRTPYVGAAAIVDRRTGMHVSVALDLTAQKKAEAELREADRKKTEFLGVLSHELRNPLAPIRNGVYLLARAQPGSERAVRARHVIERQTAHLARLVDDLLDVTRIERGKIELRRARLDASEVVRQTCEDHRDLFEAREIALDLRLSRPAWIDADPTRLAQMVGNLLQNAAKFSRRGQAVRVSVSTTGAAAEIRVRDEGLGIAPDLLQGLFEPFVQADGGLSRAQGGLGLGLALVKGLAELHGGAVRARSEGLGKGSEFVIELPLARGQAAPAQEARAGRPGGPLRVLVIDDNLDGAQTLADLLELEGHRTEIATDGRSGVAKARELRPDVILCDIGLPDMDGFEVARALRDEGALRSVRLVALSGYAQPEDRQRALEAGFDAHVAKPPDPEALLRALAT